MTDPLCEWYINMVRCRIYDLRNDSAVLIQKTGRQCPTRI